MRRIALVLPSRLCEDGSLQIVDEKEAGRVIRQLQSFCAVTVVVHAVREKTVRDVADWGVSVCQDRAEWSDAIDEELPSRLQKNIRRWAAAPEMETEEFDAVIAWGGFSPWCLATAGRRIRARRRLLWLCRKPSLYLLPEDRLFYRNLCESFDGVLESTQAIREDYLRLFPERRVLDWLLCPPVDADSYVRLARQPFASPYPADCVNLLAVGRWNQESRMEAIPGRAAQWRRKRPDLRWFILGEGKRMPHFWQQIAMHDVDREVRLLGNTDNPYPFLFFCDALLVDTESRMGDLEDAAVLFRIPVYTMEELPDKIPTLCKNRRANQEVVYPQWPGLEIMKRLIDGEPQDREQSREQSAEGERT